MMALEVYDMDEAVAYLAENGIHPSVEPRRSPSGSVRAEIKDPDGFSIELRRW